MRLPRLVAAVAAASFLSVAAPVVAVFPWSAAHAATASDDDWYPVGPLHGQWPGGPLDKPPTAEPSFVPGYEGDYFGHSGRDEEGPSGYGDDDVSPTPSPSVPSATPTPSATPSPSGSAPASATPSPSASRPAPPHSVGPTPPGATTGAPARAHRGELANTGEASRRTKLITLGSVAVGLAVLGLVALGVIWWLYGRPSRREREH